MFALKAIRTVVWGTPAPSKPRERPIRRKKRSPRSKKAVAPKEDKSKEEEPFVKAATEERNVEQLKPTTTRASRLNSKSLDPIPFRISAKPNLFDSSSSATTSLPPALEMGTPVRSSSPTKGILMTPGTALARKKAVTFHPSIVESTPQPKNGHIRSGLPHEFPGKFPSPWTPRVGTPQHKRSISIPGPGNPSRTLTFEDGPLNLDKGKKPERSTASNPTGYYEVGEDSRITDYLDESDDEKAAQQLQLEVSMHEGNATVDMDAPRSSSGQFWKERTQKIEAAALEKVDKLRTRCKVATGYAKKKDELCVDLAEKMREVIEKNKRLKAELKRLNQQSGGNGNYVFGGTTSSRATGYSSHALEEALNTIGEKDAQLAANMVEKARMENVIQRHKERLEVFEEMLDNRENKITELSMSMYNGNDDEELEEVVAELKKKLRTSKQEVKDLGVVRMEARGLRERVETLEQGYSDVTTEKARMERELERLRVNEDDMSKGTKRPAAESRLKQQVEALEKSKRELTTEMRQKTLTDAKERREAERKWKTELADMKGKVVSNGWEKEKLEQEIKELKEYATRLERELETTKKENDEFRKRGVDQTLGNDNARESQAKQRSTLQELRRVKEEASTLRFQKGRVEEQLKDAMVEIEKLKDSKPTISVKQTPGVPEAKELESASDDSAVDRSFDHWTKVATISAVDASNYTPKPTATSASAFDSPPVPALANRQKRLFSAETAPKENSDILPAPPEFSSFMATPKASENNADGSFYTQRRQRESPRAKIVNIAVTPPVPTPVTGRKVSGIGTVVPRRSASGGVTSRLSHMDPARRAAAEKRLTERKKAKMAQENA